MRSARVGREDAVFQVVTGSAFVSGTWRATWEGVRLSWTILGPVFVGGQPSFLCDGCAAYLCG